MTSTSGRGPSNRANVLGLGLTRMKLDASRGGMREWMMEDIQRSVVLVEDELEIVVVRSIRDGDRRQIRRPTPEQSDREAVALARRELHPPGVFCGFNHRKSLRSLGSAVTRRRLR